LTNKLYLIKPTNETMNYKMKSKIFAND